MLQIGVSYRDSCLCLYFSFALRNEWAELQPYVSTKSITSDVSLPANPPNPRATAAAWIPPTSSPVPPLLPPPLRRLSGPRDSVAGTAPSGRLRLPGPRSPSSPEWCSPSVKHPQPPALKMAPQVQILQRLATQSGPHLPTSPITTVLPRNCTESLQSNISLKCYLTNIVIS